MAPAILSNVAFRDKVTRAECAFGGVTVGRAARQPRAFLTAIQTSGEGAGASRRRLDGMRETQARIDSFSGSTRLIAFREFVPGTARLDS
jgi:hypothetical protein